MIMMVAPLSPLLLLLLLLLLLARDVIFSKFIKQVTMLKGRLRRLTRRFDRLEIRPCFPFLLIYLLSGIDMTGDGGRFCCDCWDFRGYGYGCWELLTSSGVELLSKVLLLPRAGINTVDRCTDNDTKYCWCRPMPVLANPIIDQIQIDDPKAE